MAERGWIGMTWPKQYGGHERTAFERYVVIEEMLAPARRSAPLDRPTARAAPTSCASAPRSRSSSSRRASRAGELSFCIGMSEPDSGSDLAGTRTRAVKVDGGFQINGSKLWTSNAHRADYMILFCKMAGRGQRGGRTATPAPRSSWWT